MLSPEDLRMWYRRLGLSEASRSVIDHIRSAPPSRRVGGGQPECQRAVSEPKDGRHHPVRESPGRVGRHL